jgi:integrase
MSMLRGALSDYLQLRRALGYKLTGDGKLLAQFLAYLEEQGADTVTTERALEWATLPAGASRGWWAYRLSVVRGFAGYLRTIDPACEVPPTGLLPRPRRRATPYLYRDVDLAALMAAAQTLRFPLQRTTYGTLIGLLAVTGLRIGEALALDRGDVDFEHGLLTVRHGKFGKSREIPLHPSSIKALGGHLRQRDELHPLPDTPALLISTRGTRLLYCNVQQTFGKLVRHAGLGPRSASCRPRLHDLRHTFAVATVLDGYGSGEDAQARLGLLCTYLGHVEPANTYWYLSAAPELMAIAAQRLERHLEDQS